MTGYTALITDEMTFEHWVLICARAMGACVEMRDQSIEIMPPDEFKPSPYHLDQLKRAEAKYQELETMSDQDANAIMEAENQQRRKEHEQEYQKRIAINTNLRRMLVKVEYWNPPTTKHRGLKNFMIQQLTESIKWDGDLPSPPKFSDNLYTWRMEKLASERRSIEYHHVELDNDLKHASEKTEWIQSLRQSLQKSQ